MAIASLSSCKNEAQIKIESQSKKIEFENRYKLNFSIEQKLEKLLTRFNYVFVTKVKSTIVQ